MVHAQPLEELYDKFNTSPKIGLKPDEIQRKVEEYGPNSLPEGKKTPLFIKFLSQFKDILVIVLIIAAIISFFFGDTLDAAVIGVIVVINAFLGFIQEARAEQALEALKNLSTDYAKVLRNGDITQIMVTELVPGDILILETGDKVPADARLIETVSMDVSEAILTGESKPVRKDHEVKLANETSLGDRKNMVYKDTTILYGRGRAVVTATGLNTEIGKISQMLSEEVKDDSPLAKQLDSVGKRLSFAAGIIVLIIFLITFLTGQSDFKQAFFTSISLAVAAIPEGLPAIVTIVLASGMSRLAKSNAIVKRLKAVETLGATNYILTDKTGTLTLNKMSVTDIVTPGDTYTIIGNNEITYNNSRSEDIQPLDNDEISHLLRIAVLCNDAEHTGEKYVGDPTETALLEIAELSGVNIKQLRERYERVYEIPFSSETKKMLVVVKNPENENNFIVMAKGAPEIMEWMMKQENESIDKIDEQLAKQGLRNLAFSSKEITKGEFESAKQQENPEEILSTYHDFAGIMSQKDPIRIEVKEALKKASNAGIKTLVLTGDNKLTATSVAKELGLISSEKEVMNGNELGQAEQEEPLTEILRRIKVFARVTPEQKLRITNTIKGQGYVVAVTGDGVNDAPAIKAADIGISMGITGTDVSKEVADMILQDDNYATIVKAIKQGRVVYDNLVKFIRYLISCNLSEVTVIGISVVVGLPLPLLPIHILWVNLVTDGFPALVLGMDKAEADIMDRMPRHTEDHLLNPHRWKRILIESVFISAATLLVFVFSINGSVEIARTAAFTTLVFAQLAHAFNNRSEEHSIFSNTLRKNPTLIGVVLGSAVLQVIIIYSNIGSVLIETTKLPLNMLLWGLAASSLPIIGTEIVKAFPKKANDEKITNIWQ